MTATATVVRGTGLVKTFHRDAEVVTALRGVDLEVGAGEIVGIQGASGSGKSTLLAVLCGWETPDSGVVTHAGGADAAGLPWQELALIPQTLGLLEDLPVEENILLPARLTRQLEEYADRADELQQRMRMTHLADRFPSQISLGEQQRASVARALLLRPRLLLADEPTAHQDAAFADVVLDLLREHAEGGGACVLVSHHAATLARADRVLSMRDGVLGGAQ